MTSGLAQTQPGTRGRRVAIIRSNYIPWKGYFDVIASVDEFIFLDNVSYTERDWRNRNLIKTSAGPRWLTVPVRHNRPSPISEVTIATDQGDWMRKQLTTIAHSYAEAPRVREILPWLQSLYKGVSDKTRLSDLNRTLVEEISSFLGITTTLSWSTDHYSFEALQAMEKTERLIELCKWPGRQPTSAALRPRRTWTPSRSPKPVSGWNGWITRATRPTTSCTATSVTRSRSSIFS